MSTSTDARRGRATEPTAARAGRIIAEVGTLDLKSTTHTLSCAAAGRVPVQHDPAPMTHLHDQHQTFARDLRRLLATSIGHDFADNFDTYRFGNNEGDGTEPAVRRNTKRKVYDRPLVARLLAKPSIYRRLLQWSMFDRLTLRKLHRHREGLTRMHALLDDQDSRDLFVAVAAFRILGHRKVKLPLSTPAFWREIEEIAARTFDVHGDEDSEPIELPRLDLKELGYPLRAYLRPDSAHRTFALQQYRWKDEIGAEPGDVVLDLGGCYGDTALYFAHHVGPSGRVVSFEFLPNNLEVLHRNLALNPELAECIEVVAQPVWSKGGVELFYRDAGRASRVRLEPFEDADARVRTTSIDEVMQSLELSRVDLIKMDIEGAETEAIQGAVATIRKFRPKLAISIYHSRRDFTALGPLIADLAPDYRFHLGHSTIHAEETILFARPTP